MRKRNFGDAINKYFKLGRDLNQRDSIAVKHTVSGLLKLTVSQRGIRQGGCPSLSGVRPRGSPPNQRAAKEDRRHGVLRCSLSATSIMETSEEKFISVAEQGGGSIIPDGPLNPGVLHTVSTGARTRILGSTD